MSEFIEILTHGRKLQGAVKTLTIEELESIATKLHNIIEKRREKEQALIQQQQEKRQKAAEIKKQMEEAGLDLTDLEAISGETKAPKKTKKRPIKYAITDENGETVKWTGIGRMPRVFKNALDNGQQLSDFSV
jgi:DNA-binding protein H-NS